MNNNTDNKYLILIKKEKIAFKALNNDDNQIFELETYIEDYSLDKLYFHVENFLQKNIFQIEKKLNSFINEIYIIFDNDKFFIAETSIKNNLKNDTENDISNDTLIEIRNQFKKHSPGNQIIHMLIKKYIIDGNIYEILPKDIEHDNFTVEVEFICLKNEIVKNFKDIFLKYQISIKKIFSYEYLNTLKDKDNGKDDIFKIAIDSLNGLNSNEVMIIKKEPENKGFFEKFFNFFN
tara:strand:+ start:128 stop:832 length:705 start_codon:yes stop_codon:yes gene_type:complete